MSVHELLARSRLSKQALTCWIVVACLPIAVTMLPAQQSAFADSLLAAGDTASAIEVLRRDAGTPAAQCLLATLLTAQATSRTEDWQIRLEARQLLEASLRVRPDPGCYLAYSALMEKQGIRVDAARMAGRAFALMRAHPELASPTIVAEAFYRRALVVAEWVRNFDHLVVLRELPVSTPDCLDLEGPFCESLHHPALFLERLQRATPLDGLVQDQRVTLAALLDSALAHDPTHREALRLALREAAVAADWNHFSVLVERAREASPRVADLLIAGLTAHVMRGRFDLATAVFDTLRSVMSAEGMARFEGLALIADSAAAERMAAENLVSYGEAVWALSDPLYLTAANERRLAHYARLYLAGVLFSDPPRRVNGRDTDQGRLLIRYGFPPYWFVVKADRSLELTAAQHQIAAQVAACANPPTAVQGGTEFPLLCSGVVDPNVGYGQGMDGGGRWIFWFYDSTAAPFIFERQLGMRIAEHKFETQSRAMDEAVARAAASSYAAPFRPAEVRALVTRFPRPRRPAVEVHARFAWDSTLQTVDSIELGYFAHDRTNGRLVRRGRAVRWTTAPAPFNADIDVPWGTLSLAVEGRALGSGAAAQLLGRLDLPEPAEGSLGLSDLLLGDSAAAPDVLDRRQQVRFYARADSLYGPSTPLAIYWEVYGLRSSAAPDTVAGRDSGVVRYRIRLRVADAGGRPVVANLIRTLGAALGLRETQDLAMEWDVERALTGDVAPNLLLLTAPKDGGSYRITVEVTDLGDGRVARTQRVIAVESPL